MATVDSDIKEQIAIRRTETTQQDKPPHYSTASRRLANALVRELAKDYPNDLSEWYKNEAPTLELVSTATSEIVTPHTNCIIDIKEDPPQITM